MRDQLIHGPVASGLRQGWRAPSSILTVPSAGDQTAHFADDRYCSAINGRFRELRTEIEMTRRGYFSWARSQRWKCSPASALWGVEKAASRTDDVRARCIPGRECELRLARDRIGKKPVYYGWQAILSLPLS